MSAWYLALDISYDDLATTTLYYESPYLFPNIRTLYINCTTKKNESIVGVLDLITLYLGLPPTTAISKSKIKSKMKT